jgi:hypothetical protein
MSAFSSHFSPNSQSNRMKTGYLQLVMKHHIIFRCAFLFAAISLEFYVYPASGSSARVGASAQLHHSFIRPAQRSRAQGSLSFSLKPPIYGGSQLVVALR